MRQPVDEAATIPSRPVRRVDGVIFEGLNPEQRRAVEAVRGPVCIHLYACNSGSGGAAYALELKVDLVQRHKVMCSVLGMKGFLGVNRLGELDVIDKYGQSVPDQTFETTRAF